jgi:hypothetical protein
MPAPVTVLSMKKRMCCRCATHYDFGAQTQPAAASLGGSRRGPLESARHIATSIRSDNCGIGSAALASVPTPLSVA